MSVAPAGLGTGIGSLPGEQPKAAMGAVIDGLPDFPHVPELPERGPWSDMVGRAVAVLVDVPAQWEGNRWRTTSRDGRDARRARAMLSEDLDAVEDGLAGYVGPAKLQMCGPLSLAAALELSGGEAAVSDPVATADLAASLAEGLLAHLEDLRKRVPGAEWVVQIDEPALSAVTAGSIPRSSGWGTVAALPAADASGLLATVAAPIEAAGATLALHCCAATPDWAVLSAGSGPQRGALSFDLTAISLEEAAPSLEAWLDAGGVLWLGVDAIRSGSSSTGTDVLEEAYAQLLQARSVLGIAPERFAEVVAVTPPCGLGGRARGSLDVTASSYAGVQTLVRRLRGDLETAQTAQTARQAQREQSPVRGGRERA